MDRRGFLLLRGRYLISGTLGACSGILTSIVSLGLVVFERELFHDSIRCYFFICIVLVYTFDTVRYLGVFCLLYCFSGRVTVTTTMS